MAATLRYVRVPADSNLPLTEGLVQVDSNRFSCDATAFVPQLTRNIPDFDPATITAGETLLPFPTYHESSRPSIPLFLFKRTEARDRAENLRARQLLDSFQSKLSKRHGTFFGDVIVFWRKNVDEGKRQMKLADFSLATWRQNVVLKPPGAYSRRNGRFDVHGRREGRTDNRESATESSEDSCGQQPKDQATPEKTTGQQQQTTPSPTQATQARQTPAGKREQWVQKATTPSPSTNATDATATVTPTTTTTTTTTTKDATPGTSAKIASPSTTTSTTATTSPATASASTTTPTTKTSAWPNQAEQRTNPSPAAGPVRPTRDASDSTVNVSRGCGCRALRTGKGGPTDEQLLEVARIVRSLLEEGSVRDASEAQTKETIAEKKIVELTDKLRLKQSLVESYEDEIRHMHDALVAGQKRNQQLLRMVVSCNRGPVATGRGGVFQLETPHEISPYLEYPAVKHLVGGYHHPPPSSSSNGDDSEKQRGVLEPPGSEGGHFRFPPGVLPEPAMMSALLPFEGGASPDVTDSETPPPGVSRKFHIEGGLKVAKILEEYVGFGTSIFPHFTPPSISLIPPQRSESGKDEMPFFDPSGVGEDVVVEKEHSSGWSWIRSNSCPRGGWYPASYLRAC